MRNLLEQQLHEFSFSYGWTYWLGWVSAGVALVGTIISHTAWCMLPDISRDIGYRFIRIES